MTRADAIYQDLIDGTNSKLDAAFVEWASQDRFLCRRMMEALSYQTYEEFAHWKAEQEGEELADRQVRRDRERGDV